MGKPDGTKVNREYKAAIDRALTSLGPVISTSYASRREPRTLEECFGLFSRLQQLGADGYFCQACNEGEQLTITS